MKDKVLEIVRQLEEDATCLPVVYLPPDPDTSRTQNVISAQEEKARDTPEPAGSPVSGSVSDGGGVDGTAEVEFYANLSE